MPEPSPERGASARGLFVAVGHDGLRVVSADGRDWRHARTGKEGEVYRAAAFGNGRFVAAGSYGGGNLFAASRDGASWQTKTEDARYVKHVRGLAFGKGEFLATGGDPGAVGNSKPFVARSADGLAWGEFEPIDGRHILRRLAFGNGVWVGVGDRGRRSASADGREWKDVPDTRALDTLADVAFGNGAFVGVGLHGLRMTTADGTRWSAGVRGEEGEHLNSVVWAGDRFVAVGAGATYSSPDGAKWTRAPNRDAPLAVAYGRGVFVGAAWKGRLLRSADGVRWEEVHKSPHHVEALAYGAAG
jgi:hypothetical protein